MFALLERWRPLHGQVEVLTVSHLTAEVRCIFWRQQQSAGLGTVKRFLFFYV